MRQRGHDVVTIVLEMVMRMEMVMCLLCLCFQID